MPRDAVSRTANVGTVGTNGLKITDKTNIVRGGIRPLWESCHEGVKVD